jgi:hypothetical protein
VATQLAYGADARSGATGFGDMIGSAGGRLARGPVTAPAGVPLRRPAHAAPLPGARRAGFVGPPGRWSRAL